MKSKINIYDQRDQSELGTKVVPPYFFGAYDEFQPVAGDPL